MAGIQAGPGAFKIGGGTGLVGPNLAPVGNLVKSVKMTGFPQFVFEYHPQVGKVIVVYVDKPRCADGTAPAAVVAEHVADDGQAFGFVQTFLRGYRLGKSGEIVAPVT